MDGGDVRGGRARRRDARSWSAKDAVRREDQFTVAPDFYDEHDSDHLPMWERLAATWHGLAPKSRVLVAGSFLVVAGAFGTVILVLSAPADPGPSQGALASEGGSAGSPVPSIPDRPLDNVTSSLSASQGPSQGPPLLPPPTFPPPGPS